MARQNNTPAVDPGLQEIAEWERGRLAGTRQLMQDNGLDADVIAAEFPAKAALIAAAANKMREHYVANRARNPHV